MDAKVTNSGMHIGKDEHGAYVAGNEIDVLAIIFILVCVVSFGIYQAGKRDGRTEYILGLKETLIYESIMGGGNARP